MNKKGFTLVELLATMAILAIISIIAVPNVIKIMAGNKKEKVVNDGLTAVALAKQEVASDIDLRENLDSTGINRNLRELDKHNDITVDPDGSNYNRDNSYVKVMKENNTVMYCVYLESEKWILENNNNCVYEDELLGDNSKRFVNENES